MEKFRCKEILESCEFFLYKPNEGIGKEINVFGFYFQNPELALAAFYFIYEQLNGFNAIIDFVVANNNRLNIFVKDYKQNLITYALNIFANDNIINNLFLNQSQLNPKRTALVLFNLDGDDMIMQLLEGHDGKPLSIIVERFFISK